MNNSETIPMAHILVVDDDREIRDLLARFLKKHGYRVTTAVDGKEMWKAISNWAIDLVVLDLMLPGDDGLTLCRNLRAKSAVPIIMLTMMNEETDRIIGLEMGADDYLPKPFNPRELLARMKAVLRRTNKLKGSNLDKRPKTLYFSGWKLEIGRRRLKSADGLLIDLSAGEFDLLVALVEHPQQVLTRDQLLDLTHGRVEAPFDRSIDMQISRLRKKLANGEGQHELIKTVRGGGYILTAAVSRDEKTDT
ncbi:MAG: response regulator [Rhizobiaceae bacterium]|nr:response regulator [Rhizobiaceae bacterium]